MDVISVSMFSVRRLLFRYVYFAKYEENCRVSTQYHSISKDHHYLFQIILWWLAVICSYNQMMAQDFPGLSSQAMMWLLHLHNLDAPDILEHLLQMRGLVHPCVELTNCRWRMFPGYKNTVSIQIVAPRACKSSEVGTLRHKQAQNLTFGWTQNQNCKVAPIRGGLQETTIIVAIFLCFSHVQWNFSINTISRDVVLT